MNQQSIKILNVLTTILTISVIAIAILTIIFDEIAAFEYLFSASLIITVICSTVNAIIVKRKSYAIIVSIVGISLIINSIVDLSAKNSASFPLNMITNIGILILLLTNFKSEKSK